MVLGIIETDPVQRARYAGLYLEVERMDPEQTASRIW